MGMMRLIKRKWMSNIHACFPARKNGKNTHNNSMIVLQKQHSLHLSSVVLSLLMILLSLLLISCGGGGSSLTSSGGVNSGGGVNIADGGIGGTGITFGRITNFGSIIVNGVRFDVDNASFIRDGVPSAGQTEFSIGEYIAVKGVINAGGTTGVATEVTFTDILEGTVTVSSIDNVTLEILGQKVNTDALTVFIGFNTLNDLSVGNITEVSGVKDANGLITATSIKLKETRFVEGTSENELKGTLSNLDVVNQSFDIGNIQVQFNTATMEGFNGQPLQNGQFVEVKSDTNISGNVFIATRIELDDEYQAISANTKAEVEGLITRFASLTDFDVNGLISTTTSATEYKNGSATNLALNSFVEVEGFVNAAGILIANEISFKDSESSVELNGLIQSTNLANNEIEVANQVVVIDSSTLMIDTRDQPIFPLRFSDLMIGNRVEIRGIPSTNGKILATRLQLNSDTVDDGRSDSGENSDVDNSDSTPEASNEDAVNEETNDQAIDQDSSTLSDDSGNGDNDSSTLTESDNEAASTDTDVQNEDSSDTSSENTDDNTEDSNTTSAESTSRVEGSELLSESTDSDSSSDEPDTDSVSDTDENTSDDSDDSSEDTDSSSDSSTDEPDTDSVSDADENTSDDSDSSSEDTDSDNNIDESSFVSEDTETSTNDSEEEGDNFEASPEESENTDESAGSDSLTESSENDDIPPVVLDDFSEETGFVSDNTDTDNNSLEVASNDLSSPDDELSNSDPNRASEQEIAGAQNESSEDHSLSDENDNQADTDNDEEESEDSEDSEGSHENDENNSHDESEDDS